MHFARAASLAIVALVGGVDAIPWAGPAPTYKAQFDDNGWTPKPTPAAMVGGPLDHNDSERWPHDLVRRQGSSAIDICGYIDAELTLSIYCQSNRLCATNPGKEALGCCTESATSCPIATACFASTQSSGYNSDDEFATYCSDSDFPECFTVYFDYGSAGTFSTLGCTDSYTTYLAYNTYIGETFASSSSSSSLLSVQDNTTATVNAVSTTSVSASVVTSSFTSTNTSSEASVALTTASVDGLSSIANNGGSGGTVVHRRKKHKSHAGAIAGGVVGGIVALAAVIALVFFLLKRNHDKKADLPPETSQVSNNYEGGPTSPGPGSGLGPGPGSVPFAAAGLPSNQAGSPQQHYSINSHDNANGNGFDNTPAMGFSTLNSNNKPSSSVQTQSVSNPSGLGVDSSNNRLSTNTTSSPASPFMSTASVMHGGSTSSRPVTPPPFVSHELAGDDTANASTGQGQGKNTVSELAANQPLQRVDETAHAPPEMRSTSGPVSMDYH